MSRFFKLVALGALAANMYAVGFGFILNPVGESTTSNNSTSYDFTGSSFNSFFEAPQNGISGLGIWGTVDFSCPTGSDCSGDTAVYTFSGSMRVPGAFPSSGTAAWDFFSNSQDITSYGWSILGQSGTGSFNTPVLGIGTFAVDPSTGNWSIALDFTPGLTSGESFSLTIPESNINNGPPATIDLSANSSSPEPATALLFATGLIGLLFARRRATLLRVAAPAAPRQ